MLLVRPLIENKFPGLEIHLCCEDRFFHILQGQPNVAKWSEFQKRDYGFYKELMFNTQTNPVEALLEESGIALDKVLKKELSV